MLSASALAERAPLLVPEVVEELDHATDAFTQGLFFHNGFLYETTGLRGSSRLRRLDPETGNVLASRSLPGSLFGEGGCVLNGRAVVLSWTAGRALRFALPSLEPRGEWGYRGQGWGLTWDGRRLIMSDGSSGLIFRDQRDFSRLGGVRVTDGGEPVKRLNELEWLPGPGLVLANVWGAEQAVAVDPVNGRVRFRLDLSGLAERAGRSGHPREVPNGLAWDPERKLLYATGKKWPRLFALRPPGEIMDTDTQEAR
ncbi:glutaminyl-peptide cyclotransferase [Desulfohalovibrio reitneri]|uniref:glutaminyl-peptide cyclotransferase n=1 Tax=Desulfohalovibrio reitneri TaxID=1307759 RepID=UPI00137700E8|nr:glutaminyl-peptide cyclotransferase [Desulfohalovibrio reitneri]